MPLLQGFDEHSYRSEINKVPEPARYLVRKAWLYEMIEIFTLQVSAAQRLFVLKSWCRGRLRLTQDTRLQIERTLYFDENKALAFIVLAKLKQSHTIRYVECRRMPPNITLQRVLY